MLLDSVETMLSPRILGELLHRKVRHVTCRPFETPNGFSGNQMFRVQADGYPLVMKRLRPTADWIALALRDTRCRSIRVWEYGLLDHIQPNMRHAILIACQDGDDYALLMQDVSAGLIRWGQKITPQMIHPMLDALAVMHAMFWEDEGLSNAALSLCHVEDIVPAFWPSTWDRYRHEVEVVETLEKGWEALFELVEPDVRDALQALMENPDPLYTALARFLTTFLHADYRPDNLALLPETSDLFFFDWQWAAYAPATIGMCWFVMDGGVFERQDEYVKYYRRHLADLLGDRFDWGQWQSMVELGCLVDVLRKGNWHALFAVTGDDEDNKAYMRQSVDSYNDIVRKGLVWL